MNEAASCGMLDIPDTGMDGRVVLTVLLPLPLRGRFPASDKGLLAGRVCFRKKSMDVNTERDE